MWLHVVAATAWVGGMLFFALVTVPLLRRPATRGAAAELIAAAGQRFKVYGWLAFAVLVITGMFNLSYRRWTVDDMFGGPQWSSPFGRALAWKLGLVGFVLGLSAIHDFWIGPRATALMRADPEAAARHPLRLAARWIGRLNLVLGLVIIYLAVAMVRGGLR